MKKLKNYLKNTWKNDPQNTIKETYYNFKNCEIELKNITLKIILNDNSFMSYLKENIYY